MKIISRVIRFITVIFTGMVILTAGILFLPRLFGYYPFVVSSGSMEPAIRAGSIAYINTKDQVVRENDVIAYLAGEDTVVLHRVVSCSQDGRGYITKGDANSVEDANPVSQEAVIGTYTMKLPGGYLLANFESRTLQLGRITVQAMSLVVIGLVIILNTADTVINANERKGGEEI